MKYRRKPIVVCAIQYDGNNVEEILTSLGMESVDNDFISNDLIIETLEGDMRAKVGDYIIKGVNGEFYPCKPDIFEKTYEAVDE